MSKEQSRLSVPWHPSVAGFTGLQVQPTPVFTGRPVYRFAAKFTGFAAKFAGFAAKFTGFAAKFTRFTGGVNFKVV